MVQGASTTDSLSQELPSTTDKVPRWLGARGVTNTSAREEELGMGKWTDVGPAVKEWQDEMDSAPVRELEIEEAGLPWLQIFFVLIVLGLAGWWFFGSTAEGEVSTPKTSNRTITKVTPDIPKVTVDTTPSGAIVYLEGVSYGPSPTVVPVPTDSKEHELCVEYKGERTCRRLTGEALAFQDPYRFVIRNP